MIAVEQLQSYLRRIAHQHYQSLAVPPFTLFFHSTDAFPFFNYAIPDAPVQGDVQAALVKLREAFDARGRQPRFEFIEAFAPELPAALLAAGFVEESRLHLMVCTPETYQPTSAVPDLSITMLTTQSPLDDVIAFKMTQQQGFEPDNYAPIDEAAAREFRERIGTSGRFLGRINGQPVGAAVFSPPLDGVTEVTGVATLEAFRRRGIAAAVTAEAMRVAFARGVQVVCLSAADERAGRVYERVGFRPFTTMLAYHVPA